MALAARLGVLCRAAASRAASAFFVAFLILFFIVDASCHAAVATVLGPLAGTAAARIASAPAAGLVIDAEIDIAFVFALVFIFIIRLATTTAMRCQAALAGDLALLFRVHGGETATAVLVGGLTVAVGYPGVPVRIFVIACLMVAGRLTVMVGGGFVMEGGISMVGRPAALAGDFASLFRVHGGETAFALLGHDAFSLGKWHDSARPISDVPLNQGTWCHGNR
jgi:hypothetical protein